MYSCATNHACAAAADPAKDGMACDPDDPAMICSSGSCVINQCGNGVRDPGENCDDGNRTNLDGCDSSCLLEQDARIISLQQQFVGDAFCPNDALGTAITEVAQEVIQGTWDGPVADGSLSLVFKFLGVTQPLGPTTNTAFRLGFIHATPVPADNYDGTKDLDWWYVRDPESVDASEVPKVQLAGEIAAGQVTAGPGTISLDLLFALQPANVTLYNAKVAAKIDAGVAAPKTAVGSIPVGHRAAENLDPAITTFTTSSDGAMCSDVSVKSLLDTPMPALLTVVCTDDAGQNPVFSTDTNHLLDAFIAGCKIFGTQGIAPTQPDGSRDGAIYHFALDPVTMQVTGCTRDGAPAELAMCAEQATYSSYFKFKSDRVIIHRE